MKQLKIARRAVGVFLAVFVSCTVLDHITTKVGLGLGYRELNPFTDFSTTASLIMPEAIAVVVGCASIMFGIAISGRRFFERECLLFDEFENELRSKKYFWVWLTVVGPLVIAFGRALVVLNNLGVIALGWGFMEVPQRFFAALLNLPMFVSGIVVDAVFLALLVKPTMWIVWRCAIGDDKAVT